MLHYLAVIQRESSPREQSLAQSILAHFEALKQWETVYRDKGILILCRRPIPEPISIHLPPTLSPTNLAEEKPGGVIIGTVFRRRIIDDDETGAVGNGGAANKTAVLSNAEWLDIVDSGGKSLIDHYWGRYIAFIHHKQRDTCIAVADPTGGIPCLHAKIQGMNLFCSDINDISEIGVHKFSIDWPHIATHMLYGPIQGGDTGLRDVEKLLPGQATAIARTRITTEYYWNPVELSRHGLAVKPGDAARELRRITKACVRAWGSCYSDILLKLSGGFDSSLVLACMDKGRRPHITALNYFSPSMSDERQYARLAAAEAGVALTETQPRIPAITPAMLAAVPKTAKPASYHFALNFAAYEAQLAKARGATAMFTGDGGDEVLYPGTGKFTAIDYALLRGMFSPGMLAAAVDSARISRKSLLSVLAAAVRTNLRTKWFKRTAAPLADQLRRYQPSEVIGADVRNLPAPASPYHPLLERESALPPGKLLHLAMVLMPHQENPPVMPADYLDRVRPLYSQPIIEYCLRLPSWQLCLGGVNRGLARRAFGGDLPGGIATRTAKASGNHHHQRIFEAHRDLVEEMLFDGVLVKERFLEQRQLENALFGSRTRMIVEPAKIMSFVSLEAWLRKWL